MDESMFGWFKRRKKAAPPRERILVREQDEDVEEDADDADDAEDRPLEEEELPRWYYVLRLAARVARRRKLRELNAPVEIIDKDTELIASAVNHLPATGALSVLMQWKTIAPLDDPNGEGHSDPSGDDPS